MLRTNGFLVGTALLAVSLSIIAKADNGAYANAGGAFSTGTAVGGNISIQGAAITGTQATLSLTCPITAYGAGTYAITWTCAGGVVTIASPDNSLVLNGTVSSGSMSFSGSGGGRGGHTTYYYDFFGTFSGVVTSGGVTEDVNGSLSELVKTSRQIGTGTAPVTSGSMGWNSAYSPVLVGDATNSRLLRADNITGANLSFYGSPGSGVGNFGSIAGLAQDTAGRVYISDSSLNRLVRIDNLSGSNWTEVGGYGAGVNQFNQPRSVAIDAGGKIWVADSGNSRIVRMEDATGKNWTAFGTAGAGVNQFSAPSSIAFDPQGRIYVGDAGNNRLVRIDDIAGTNWTTLAQVNIDPYGYPLAAATGVVVNPTGRIFVATAGGYLIGMDDMTGANGSATYWGGGIAGISRDKAGSFYLIGSFATGLAQSADASGSGYFTGMLGLPSLQASAVLARHSTVPTPAAPVFSVPSISFGSRNVGEPSSAKNIRLLNLGSASLTIASVTVDPGFLVTDGCASPLQPGQSCGIGVQFDPTATGAQKGNLSVASNGVHSLLHLPLSGIGTAPAANVFPAALTFDLRQTGTSSTAQSVTLTNPGSGPLTIASIVATGDFTQTSNCGTVVAAGSGCLIHVVFKPSSTGTRSGGLTISDDAIPTGTKQTVSLQGTGSATAAAFTLTPEGLLFPAQEVSTTSAAQPVTLTNHSGATASLGAPTYPTGFKGTTTCGAKLANGANCTLKVQFKPTAAGEFSASMAIPITGKPSLSLGLTGTGAVAGTPAVLRIGPASIDFGSQVIGDNPSLKATITNPGGVPAGIQSISLTGAKQFTKSSNCPSVLAGGASCSVTITFLPDSSSYYDSGTLTIVDSLGNITPLAVTGYATADNGN